MADFKEEYSIECSNCFLWCLLIRGEGLILYGSYLSLLYCGNNAGGLLLSILATTSTLLDHYLRRINEGFALGFTSVLIIVSPI